MRRNYLVPFTKLLSLMLAIWVLQCCSKFDEHDQRLLDHLRSQNEYMSFQLTLKMERLKTRVDDQVAMGYRINEHLYEIFKELNATQFQQHSVLAEVTNDEITASDLQDSLKQVLVEAAKSKRTFWATEVAWPDNYNWDDSLEEIAIAAIETRFSNDNKTYWPLELAMLESDLMVSTKQKLDALDQKLGCMLPHSNSDTISIFAYPLENPVEAGAKANVFVGIRLEMNPMNAEFSSPSGSFQRYPDQVSAILHVKTSPNMIPEGQEFGYAPYAATANVAKSDGTIQTLQLRGKVKVRRPCITPD